MCVADIKTIFMGTSEFAVASLHSLLSPGYEVVAVVTQPDRPAGRGLALKASPVKETALKTGLRVLQPERMKEPGSVEALAALRPDLMVVVAYGQILPPAVLALPRMACLNVHASLLPKFRGAAPIHAAILEGETETGVTLMHMNEKMDEGDLILSRSTPIGPDETVGELHDRLAVIGASALMEALVLIAQGRATRTPQDPARATYAPSLKRERCRMDWTRTARELHDQVRGLSPWPVAETQFKGGQLRIFRSRFLQEGDPHGVAGTIQSVTKEGIVVAAGRDALLLTEVQVAGKKRMGAYELTLGHPDLVPGAVLT